MPNANPLQQPPTQAVYPSIPEPTVDPSAMLETLKRIKETVEIMAGQRGPVPFAVPEVIRSINDLQKKVVTDIDFIKSGTAEVKVYASAEGTVEDGYQAIYGWRVRAGDISTGMYNYVTDAGDAETVFSSTKFKLQNPNVEGNIPKTIFNYDGAGAFTFGVPVKIGSAEITDLAVTTGKFADLSVMNEKIYGNAVSVVATAMVNTTNSLHNVSATVNLRGTGAILVHGYIEGRPITSNGNTHVVNTQLVLERDGNIIMSADPALISQPGPPDINNNPTTLWWLRASVIAFVDVNQPGVHTYNFRGRIPNNNTDPPFQSNMRMVIEVVELSK